MDCLALKPMRLITQCHIDIPKTSTVPGAETFLPSLKYKVQKVKHSPLDVEESKKHSKSPGAVHTNRVLSQQSISPLHQHGRCYGLSKPRATHSRSPPLLLVSDYKGQGKRRHSLLLKQPHNPALAHEIKGEIFWEASGKIFWSLLKRDTQGRECLWLQPPLLLP